MVPPSHILGALLISLTPVFGEISFNRDVLPILSDACFTCHGPDSATREADLRLDLETEAKASAIVPGHPEKSELIARILHHDPDEVMPPPDSRRPLTAAEKQTLHDWIKQGAKWEQHWAFVKPTSPPLPGNSNPDWTKNPIDHFILKTLEQNDLVPSPEASREKIP